MQATQLSLELKTALFERAILNVVLQVVREVHHFPLENLHLVHHLFELNLIPDDPELFLIQVTGISRHSHIDPVVLLLNHVVDPFDAHQEPEDCVVALKRVLVKDDLEWPIALKQTIKVS